MLSLSTAPPCVVPVLQLRGGGHVPLLLEHLLLLHQVSAGALARRPQTNLPQEEMNRPRPPVNPSQLTVGSPPPPVSQYTPPTHTHVPPASSPAFLRNFMDISSPNRETFLQFLFNVWTFFFLRFVSELRDTV